MTIKIYAPRGRCYPNRTKLLPECAGRDARIVRESDWRRIMAVVRAADQAWRYEDFESMPGLSDALRELEGTP